MLLFTAWPLLLLFAHRMPMRPGASPETSSTLHLEKRGEPDC